MQDNYFTRETLKAALEAKGITTNAQAQPVIDAMIKKGAIIQGVNEPAPTLGSKLMERGKTVLSEVTAKPARDILQAGAGTQGTERALTGTEALLRTAQAPIRAIGAVGGAVGDVIGSGLEAVGADELIGGAVQPVLSTSPIQKAMDAYKQLPQDTQDVLGSILNTANVPLGGVGASVAKSGLETGVKAVGGVAKAGAGAVADNSLVQGAGTVLKSMGESAKRIPDRIATNVADKQATELAIKSLPTKTAQTAVGDGVDIIDVKDISNITRTPQVNKLIDTVKRFASGDKTVDPIEVVGEPIVQRVKTLADEGEVIGKKLGEASKTIGILTKPELQSGVLTRLQSVNGLSGIKLTPKGLLNFKGTTLESALSKADRQAIQQAYTEATKWGDGIKAHNFRQTLFENLGGKKKSLANITDTQERAFEAIRSGLSDVIETKSPTYKTLSNEYRKIVQPLGQLRKLMKNIDPNSSEDILNMSSGLLARRITSAASSNPQIKQILQALDNAGTKGTTKESVTQLQDMYNILNKYYDIAPKTGFQNLVKEGVSGSESITGIAKEALKNVAGQSNPVRQKALENLLEELGVVLK